jgi:threonine dehydratase
VSLAPPSFDDVLAARQRIAPLLRPTPAFRYPALDALVGAETWVKHENHQPIGAFKVRGGVNLVSRLSEKDRRRGVITASTGNHGQSIAFAARAFRVRATICVPEVANPVKVESMRALGAELVFHGRDFDDAREECERRAARGGLRYVHSADEPDLIAGVATETLEVLEAVEGLDAVIVPIGGGSGAAGACVVCAAVAPGVRVIGVSASAAPASFRSWAEGELAEDVMGTAAEGLATRVGFDLPQRVLREHLAGWETVSEEELLRATYLMIEKTKNLCEPSGAAPLAAALRLREELAGKRIALIQSGGNIAPAQLEDVLRAGRAAPASA